MLVLCVYVYVYVCIYVCICKAFRAHSRFGAIKGLGSVVDVSLASEAEGRGFDP